MFVLVENQFSSDANEYVKRNLGYSMDENILVAVVAKKTIELKNSNEAYKKFHEEILPAWDLENPAPDIKPYKTIDDVKWQSIAGQKQVITDEMREERQAIREKNKIAQEEAYREYREWSGMRLTFINETYPQSFSHEENIHWEVEPLEEIKE